LRRPLSFSQLHLQTLATSNSSGKSRELFFFSSFPRGYCNAKYYGTVTSRVHDARKFCLDLIKELHRLHSPLYPQREFWLALELADNADVVRAVTAINALEDACYFDRQQSRQFTDLDDVDPRYLIAGYSRERAAARAAHARSFTKVARAQTGSCP